MQVFCKPKYKTWQEKKKSRNNEKINFKTLVFTNKKKEEYEN